MATMPNAQDWIAAARHSHDSLVDLTAGLDEDQVRGPSYASEWTIADTASHLGSQAEIFQLSLAAGIAGEPAPGVEAFGPIWDRWNALDPSEQVGQSIAANERLTTDIETLPAADRDAFAIALFGRDVDLAGLLTLRLGEHALHRWDIAVALDPAATVLPDSVALLVDTQPAFMGQRAQPVEGADGLVLVTTDPGRAYRLTVGESSSLTPTDAPGEDPVTLPAEAFLRLIAGRLDPDHTPAGLDDPRIPLLRQVFVGF